MGGLWLRPFIFYFFFFIHYPHLNWLGQFTGKKNGRRILPLHFLWFGWGGSGFGDIYQFVIYLRRFFFFFFSCLTKEKSLLILFHLYINIYIYIFFSCVAVMDFRDNTFVVPPFFLSPLGRREKERRRRGEGDIGGIDFFFLVWGTPLLSRPFYVLDMPLSCQTDRPKSPCRVLSVY